MTTPVRHDAYPCSFDTLEINDVKSVQEAPGQNEMVMIAGGNVSPSSIALNYAEPKITLATADLATVLDDVSLSTGLAISSAFEVQYERRASGGVYAGSGSHITMNGTKGYLCVTGISVEQDAAEGAEAQLEFWALSTDGRTAPWTMNTSQSLAGTPAVPGRFALGPTYANGALITGVTSVKVETGKKIEAKRTDGALFATTVSVMERVAAIELSVLNAALADEAALGYFIKAMSGSGIICYLEKIQDGGGRVGAAEDEHISISGATGVWKCSGQQANAKGDLVTTIRATLTSVLVVATDATIPV